MFTEVIKLIPKLDSTAMNTMFTRLNRRFAAVAKGFGRGMKNALKLSPILAVAGALMAKLVNPLQKAEEAIDRLLNKGDNAVTNAAEFGTSPGSMMVLEGLAATTGLESEQLRMMMAKYQSAVARESEASQQPGYKPGILSEFRNDTDMAQSFFDFIRSTQNLPESQRVNALTTIIGEERVKASEFFGVRNWGERIAQMPAGALLGDAAVKAASLQDRKQQQDVNRDLQYFVKHTDLVQPKMIDDIDRSERNRLDKETESLLRYDETKSASLAIQELTAKFDKFVTYVMNTGLPLITKSFGLIETVLVRLEPHITSLAKWTQEAPGLIKTSVKGFSDDMNNVWEQFKSSPIYKGMGGGKK